MKRIIGLVSVLVVLGFAVLSWASPAEGVTATLIGRATFQPFRVKTHRQSLVDIDVKAKSELDVIVRTHDYAPFSSSGWHTHPGPVFVSVVEGVLTFYDFDDPACTPKYVSAGEGFVDTGSGHIVRNESGVAAKEVVVSLAPVGFPFRDELPAPNAYCGF